MSTRCHCYWLIHLSCSLTLSFFLPWSLFCWAIHLSCSFLQEVLSAFPPNIFLCLGWGKRYFISDCVSFHQAACGLSFCDVYSHEISIPRSSSLLGGIPFLNLGFVIVIQIKTQSSMMRSFHRCNNLSSPLKMYLRNFA